MASSDGDSEDGSFSARIVQASDTRMTLELVVEAGTQPGQLIRFPTRLGTVIMTIPSGVVPGRMFRVDVVPGSGDAVWCSVKTSAAEEEAARAQEAAEDKSEVTIVRSNDTRMTLELVMPAGSPGQLIRFQTRHGWVKIVIPSGVVPGHKFRVDVVRGSGAAVWCSAETCGSSGDGLEDEDGLSSRSEQDNFSAKIVALEDANVTIELVVPMGMQPGERINFKAPVGMPAGHPLAGKRLHVKTPSDLGPGRTHLVHWTPPAPARSTDGSGSAHGSEYAGQVLGKVMACVDELCRWQQADGPAVSQQARAQLLKQLSELVASDEQLFGASTDARAHTVLGYLEMFQQLRTADWDAAQVILAALQGEGPSPDRASPLQAIQGLLVVVHDGTKVHGCRGNFVGLDIDSGR